MLSRFILGGIAALTLLALASCGGPTGLSLGFDYQDLDSDGIRNGLDADIDGDGVANEHDLYPLNYYGY